ncbi:Stealth CR1 domain-containing protein [Neisseria subflava]|uniref:Stealth CR1 domain-containing protein n=1 Tax=Neisseria subflava TaxID=28449 RepID=A0A9X9HUK2_NEISU|nr:Stealth CR1 domain-containing protein [Neisseria subflava]UTG69811.1 Stealth CR1 domain-containing protein [Neisseria subflava]
MKLQYPKYLHLLVCTYAEYINTEDIIYEKIQKFFQAPGLFFRDYFNKKYPVINNEQNVYEDDEYTLIKNSLKLSVLDATVKKDANIDVVFTWVNNQDPAWQKKYSVVAESFPCTALYSNDEARQDKAAQQAFFALCGRAVQTAWKCLQYRS